MTPPGGPDGPARGERARPNIRVLVVDDKAFIREMIGRVLRGCDLPDVVYAASGSEALRAIDTDPLIALVICDLVMPDIDGIEVARHVANRPSRPAFVFVSGASAAVLSASMHTARARGLSVLGVLEKPVTAGALAPLLELLEKSPASGARRPDFDVTREGLGNALARHEIGLHFQPKVAIGTGEAHGFEALVRWNHPEQGCISPQMFLPLAEEAGLIAQLSDRVFDLALRQLGAWNAVGARTKVSVNLSPSVIVDLDLPSLMSQRVKDAGIDPDQIVLEITESGAFKNAADTLDILARLRMRGFELSIDDFGTGYSSLDQLRQAPFSELKIDRAFVRGAGTDTKARAILLSSTQMGKAMGLTVVAEGAETEEDLALLAACGADLVQGYVIARPMPAAAALAWLKNRTGAPFASLPAAAEGARAPVAPLPAPPRGYAEESTA